MYISSKETLDFANMCKSMEKVGFSSKEKHDVFRVVAAICMSEISVQTTVALQL